LETKLRRDTLSQRDPDLDHKPTRLTEAQLDSLLEAALQERRKTSSLHERKRSLFRSSSVTILRRKVLKEKRPLERMAH
jgi:hypothetical protein